MKKEKIFYWISTGLISLMMLSSVFMYLTNDAVKAGFQHLGYPDYFRIELAFAKLLGVITLLLPGIWRRLKEWAYFGFALTYVSAAIAHLTVGDPASAWSAPIIAFLILFTSYYYYHQLNDGRIKDQKPLRSNHAISMAKV